MRRADRFIFGMSRVVPGMPLGHHLGIYRALSDPDGGQPLTFGVLAEHLQKDLLALDFVGQTLTGIFEIRLPHHRSVDSGQDDLLLLAVNRDDNRVAVGHAYNDHKYLQDGYEFHLAFSNFRSTLAKWLPDSQEFGQYTDYHRRPVFTNMRLIEEICTGFRELSITP